MAEIDGVKVIPLKKFPDERGTIYQMLRSSDPHFKQFGEIYFSKIYKKAIKGWHTHKLITLNYCVIYGMVKLVLFDSRENSPTKNNLMELFIGDDNYCLVIIPPGVTNGHKGLSDFALLASTTDLPYDRLEKDEMLRIDPYDNEIPYNWKRKDS
jgi:dTDP-4-dehydrorhamnose 3,5-epimerase